MRLPNADQAVISPDKLRGYLLSASHPVGRFKAVFFGGLGYTEETWTQLETDLRTQHLTSEAEEMTLNRYARKFRIVAPLTGPTGGDAMLVSIWVIRNGEEVPRFVTAYPGEQP